MKLAILLITSFGAYLLMFNFQKVHILSDCTLYKNGIFYYHFRSQSRTTDFTVTRNDSTQIEINQQTGNSALYKIHWSNECSYELKFVSGTEVLSKELLDLKRRMIVRTKILSGTSDYYIYETTSNITTTILKDTIWLRK